MNFYFNKTKRTMYFSLLAILATFISTKVSAQVDVTASAGTPTATYTTLKGAFDAINLGTHQGVIGISLTGSTTETATPSLNASGGTASYTAISITPTTTVTIQATYTAANSAVIKLNGADNVTIDGRIGGTGNNITVANNSTIAATAAIWLASTSATASVAGVGCTNNTIRNLNIIGGNAPVTTSTNNNYGIIQCGITIGITANGPQQHNNTYTENNIIKARYGIVTRGLTTANNYNISITNNIIGPASGFGADAIGKTAILVQADSFCTISGNIIRYVGGTFGTTSGGTDRLGIAVGTDAISQGTTTTITSNNYTVINNKISDIVEERTFSSCGINIATTRAGNPTNNIIANNMITNVKANATSGDFAVGIIYTGGHTDKVVFNSINMYGDVDPDALAVATNMYAAGIRISAPNGTGLTNHQNLTLANNVVKMDLSSSSTPGFVNYAFMGYGTINPSTYSFGTGIFNNNNFYVNPSNTQCVLAGLAAGTSSLTAAFPTTGIPTITSLQAAYTTPYNLNTVSGNPGFLSNADLHIDLSNPNNANVSNNGTPIAGVSSDIDGDIRNVSTPDMGADEFASPPCTGTPNAGIATPLTTTKCLNQAQLFSASGLSAGTGIEYQWQVSSSSGGPFTNVTLGSGANSGTYSTGTNYPAGTYYFQLATTCTITNTSSSTNAVEFIVNSLPTVSISASSIGYCAPNPVNLMASGASTYTWAPSGSLSNSNTNSVDATPTFSTTYTVLGTDANGCTNTTSLLVNAGGATILSTSANPLAICAGGSATVSATATSNACNKLLITEVSGFETGTGFGANIFPGVVIDPIEITNISDLPIDLNGVQLEITGTSTGVYVIPAGNVLPPDSTFVIGRAGSVPASIPNRYANTALIAVGSGTSQNLILSAGGTILDVVSINGGVPVNPVGTGNPVVTAADWSGTIASSSGTAGIRRTVLTDNNNASDWTVASGANLTNWGTPNGNFTTPACPITYTWEPSSLFANNVGNNIVATAIPANTVFTVTGTDAAGCESQSTLQILNATAIDCNPIAISGPACVGLSVLTASATGGSTPYTYSWTIDGNAAGTNSATLVATLGTHTYAVTVSEPCGTTCMQTIVHTANPAPTAIITPLATLCDGAAYSLNATSDIGDTYSWSSSTLFTSSNAINPLTAALSQNGTYTVIVSNSSSGCTASSSINLSVSALPAFNVNATPASVCEGAVYTVSASASNPYCTVTVTSGACGNDEFISNVQFNTINNASTCTGTGGSYIANNYEDFTSISTAITAGSTYSLNITYGPFFSGDTVRAWFDWNQDGDFIDAGETYTVTPSGTTGATGINTIIVAVPATAINGNTRMRVRLNFNAQTLPCGSTSYGNTEDYTVNVTGGGISGIAYNWMPGNISVSSFTATATAATTYTATATNTFGCTNSSSVSVTVSPIPTVTASGTPITGFSGYTSNLSASGADTYVWLPATGLSDNLISNPVATVTNAINYTVTGTNTVTGCTSTALVSLSLITPTVIIDSAFEPFCFGQNSGSIFASTNMLGTITWSITPNTATNNNDGTFSNVPQGTYTVTATNGSLTASAAYLLAQPSDISASFTSINIACFGGLGSAYVYNISGGVPYSGAPAYFVDYFNSSNAQLVSSDSIFNLGVGSYYVTIEDFNGCIDTTNFTILEPTLLTASSMAGTILCNGGTTTVAVSAMGGTTPYSGTGTFTVSAGAYSYTVTDANGCTAVAAVNIAQPAPIAVNINASSTSVCAGSSFSLNLTSNPAPTGYCAAAASQSGDEDIVNVTFGTINNTSACASLVGTQGTATGSANLYANYTANSPAIVTTGDSIPFSVSINQCNNGAYDNQAMLFIDWNRDGDFDELDETVYISPFVNTTGTTTYTTSVVVPLTASIGLTRMRVISTENNSANPCGAQAWGEVEDYNINIIPVGFTYSWAPSPGLTNANTASASNSSATTSETYTLTVTDANGCTGTSSVSITVNPLPTVSVTSSDTVLVCAGTIVSLTANGADAYSWAPAANLSSNSGAIVTTTASGINTYTVTGTSVNGCAATSTVMVQITTPIIATSSATNTTLCSSASTTLNAIVNLNVIASGYCTPGTTNAGASDDILNVVFGGINNSTTFASNPGSNGYSNFTNSVAPANVIAGTTQSITVTVNNGGPEFAAYWLDANANGIFEASEFGSIPLSLGGGLYFGTANIAIPSTAVGSVRLRVRSRYNVALSSTQSCSAYNFGETEDYLVNIAPAAPLAATYTWMPGSLSGAMQTVSPTSSTVYTVTGTDNNGCTATSTVSITVNPAVTLSATPGTILCNGGTADITLTTGGGTGSIVTSPANTGLVAGTYTFTATDAAGCTSVVTATLTQPTALTASATNTPILCNGGTSTITVSSMGGTMPVSGTGTFVVNAGAYSYTVTDANGCSTIVGGMIMEPAALTASASNTPILCNGGTSTITVSSMGGTMPISGTGTFVVNAGPYSYTVTDANGCSTMVSGMIMEPSALNATATNTSILCNGGTSTVTVSALGGTMPYASGTGTFVANAGLYFYTVIDANGCTAIASGFIMEPDSLIASASNTPILCNGGTSTITVSSMGGTMPISGTGTFVVNAGAYSYTVTDVNGCSTMISGMIMEPAALTASASNTPILCNGGTSTITVSSMGGTMPISGTGTFVVNAGPYSYTVTDANGCSTMISGMIMEPAALTASASNTPILCNGSTSTVTVNSMGGTMPVSGTGTFVVNAGSYSYTVTDANGCSTAVSGMIMQPSAIVIAPLANQIACAGGSGEISWTTTGGTGAISVSVNGTPSTSPYSNAAPGTYTLMATDANGCTKTETIVINAAPPALTITLTANPSTILCNGGTTELVAKANGGTPYGSGQYVYGTSSTVPQDSFSAMLPVSPVLGYTVIATDFNGCTVTGTILITQPTAIMVSSMVVNNVSCFGGNDGTVSVSGTGGTGAISIMPAQSGLAAGTYTFTATDANGCTKTKTVTITQPTPVMLTATAVNPICSYDNGSVNLSSSGGTGSIATSPANTNLAPGTYTFTGTDANGCTGTASATLIAPSAVTLTAMSSGTNVPTGSTITVTVMPSSLAASVAGPGGLSFSSSTNAASGTVVVANAGILTVTGTDANGCTGTTTINVNVFSGSLLSLKVLLSGNYDATSMLMTDSLRALGLIPTTEPYSAAPYNLTYTHVNGGGGEATMPSVFTTTGNDAIVDWVFVQLRSASNSSMVVATRSALLQRDGDIVEVDGVSPVVFANSFTGNYYISVEHRNHLGIMTAMPQTLTAGVNTAIDLTTFTTPLFTFAGKAGNPAPLTGPTRIIGGKRALYAGNCNVNLAGSAHRFISYNNLASSDRNALMIHTGATGNILGYSIFDVDLNGYARFNGLNPDRLVISQNTNNSNTINTNEQTPN
jgi:hypothetical protein